MPLELVETSQPQQQGYYGGQRHAKPEENGGRAPGDVQPQPQPYFPQALPQMIPTAQRGGTGPGQAMPQMPRGFAPGVPAGVVPAGMVMMQPPMMQPPANGLAPTSFQSHHEGLEELERASRDKLTKSLEKTRQAA